MVLRRRRKGAGADRASDWPALGDVEPRVRVRIRGTVFRIRLRPSLGMPTLEVTLADDSGSVVARWLGREAIAGVGLGRQMVLEGVASRESGALVLLNPIYELLPMSGD